MSPQKSLIALIFACVLAAPLQAEERNLQLKLSRGTVLHITSRVENRTWFDLPDRSNLDAVVCEVQTREEVIDVDAAGNMLFRVSFEWVTMKRWGAIGETNYDSRIHRGGAPAEAAAMAASSGESYQVWLSPQGRVIELRGTQEMMNRMLAKLRLTPQDAKRTEQQIREASAPEHMKGVIESSCAFYPGREAGIGDEWQAQCRIPPLSRVLIPIVYKLIETQDGQATLKVTGEMDDEFELVTLSSDPVTQKVQLAGRLVGSMVVDEATGMKRTSELYGDLAGHLVVKDRKTARVARIPMRSRIIKRMIVE